MNVFVIILLSLNLFASDGTKLVSVDKCEISALTYIQTLEAIEEVLPEARQAIEQSRSDKDLVDRLRELAYHANSLHEYGSTPNQVMAALNLAYNIEKIKPKKNDQGE